MCSSVSVFIFPVIPDGLPHFKLLTLQFTNLFLYVKMNAFIEILRKIKSV